MAEVLVDNDVEFVVDLPALAPAVPIFPAVLPVIDVVEDLYVCDACGSPLTEIPTYNRYYCENCGLHY
ncbi:MAG TPA: hypothetical protein VLV18_00040 [Terriglobales bacterium]|nr:hypothetical protein [Terriglobales bacterium]